MRSEEKYVSTGETGLAVSARYVMWPPLVAFIKAELPATLESVP
jgi:hypothetical protein